MVERKRSKVGTVAGLAVVRKKRKKRDRRKKRGRAIMASASPSCFQYQLYILHQSSHPSSAEMMVNCIQ